MSVFLYDNEISSVDFSGDTAIDAIDLDNNALATLTLSGLTNLEDVDCANNQLTQINLTGCSALINLDIPQNNLESIDLSDCVVLEDLEIDSNQLTTLDVSATSSLINLTCDSNDLSSLTLGTQNDLEFLVCSNNQLTSLDISSYAQLYLFMCNDNQFSGTLDISDLEHITILLYQNNNFTKVDLGVNPTFLLYGYNNPTTEIKTKLFREGVSTQTFSANGDGYVCLTIDIINGEAFLYAQGLKSGAFVNYTVDGTEISTSPIHYFDVENLETDDITANFSNALTSSNAGDIVYEGGRITITPLFEGGTWQYDKGFLSADFSDPENPVFKGLKVGKTTVSYTLPANTYTYEEPFPSAKSIDEPIFTTEGEEDPDFTVPDLPDQNLTISMAVTINETVLPQTGQDFTVSVILAGTGLAGITALFLVSRRKKKDA
jgi:LPXTG-motif cell wall-anchored protein